ncbi:MAG: hypothetical protein V3W28_06170 [Thermoplasmata archaeon]
MNIWSLLSAVAIFTAGFPAIYFLVAMKNPSHVAVGLMTLFIASIVAHTLFHLSEALAGDSIVSIVLEVVSAAAIVGFAFVYWPSRRKKR